MRIVIDMQGVQTDSRFRGIGRYTMAFAQAVVRNRGEHEIILCLSGLFPDTIEPIRAAFYSLIPQENVRVWYAPGSVCQELYGNDARREAAELIREAFLRSLQPDVIHITSLFEGYVDDAVTSVGRFDTETPVSITLYDLIPLLNPEHYLKPNPSYELYYLQKCEHLKKSALHLAISESSRHEGIAALGRSDDNTIAISAGLESHFQPQSISESAASKLCAKFGIARPFVLYTGGADERKNLPRLIRAYALLPGNLRNAHQLLLAGKMPEGNIANLEEIARSSGLKNDELLFPGFVSDEELVQLYNLCQLYIFPSWHEGFGLPALEAMACGAPVIAANTSSLPEVIGLEKALFDPFEVKEIFGKLKQALEDEHFRNDLREHGLQRSKKFSWDATANRAITAWESLPCRVHAEYLDRSLAHHRLLIALAQPLAHCSETELVAVSQCIAQNELTGIERQLLLDVSELCQHDSGTGVQRVVRSYLRCLLQSPPSGFRVEPVYATRGEAYRYARCFTQCFQGLNDGTAEDAPVSWQRGDVFFGLDMQHHVQLAHASFFRQLMRDGVVVKFLVHDLLPVQLADLFNDSNCKELHERWLALIAATDGAICVSQATSDAFNVWIKEHDVPQSPTFQSSWVHNGADIDGSMPSLGMPDDAQTVLNSLVKRPSFLCVSTIEPRKCQQQILEAIEQLWQNGDDVNLVLVGQQGWQIDSLAERLRAHAESGRRLFWLEGISDEYLDKIYATSTCLIAASLNEGFGLSLIEAARHSLPIIARDIPVFREVAGDHVEYFLGDTAEDLASVLAVWLDKYRLGQHRLSTGMQWFTWQQSTDKLKECLIGKNYPIRQLLVDVSELVQQDAKTGIQRVVRNILGEWLRNPPEGFRVEPVYATLDQPYRYARAFTAKFLGMSTHVQDDESISFATGDVFLGLDLSHHVPKVHHSYLRFMQEQGVHVWFIVYDLLPIQFPEFWESRHRLHHVVAEWMSVIAGFTGAVCISRSVADELQRWMLANGPQRQRPFAIDWFHLGADIDHSEPTNGLLQHAPIRLSLLQSRPTFLMVGTVEPRKGYTQVLEAFDLLWHLGSDVNLVIVGKEGWLVNQLIERIRSHPERNKRLFWLEGISDVYLDQIYAASTCLIAASYGEGFGLPLIEAAQHQLPIIARDIPVFREVAGQHAYYFNTSSAFELSKSVKYWLELYQRKVHPNSVFMQWLTWQDSACQLAKIMVSSVNQEC
jgi:glycosyltransferase involved in cell wall biosynthesis